MSYVVLDKNFKAIYILDTYESLIWTERYNSYGDFELYMNMDINMLTYIKPDYFMMSRRTDRLMIIETISIKSDTENGNKLIVTGRSLESILTRRIIWGQQAFRGKLTDAIIRILNENIVNPSRPERRILNLAYNIPDKIIKELSYINIDTQYTGDNVYDIIKNLSEVHNIGFKIILNEGYMVFSLYRGKDRSYSQNKNPYVIFSPDFENIINSNYIFSSSNYKSISLIGGEGEGENRFYTEYGSLESGIDRRELFVDARDISKKIDNDNELSVEEYTKKLVSRGIEKLLENKINTSFEGETDTHKMFVYGKDFFLGDEVQINNEYGHQTKARIVEVVVSENSQGISIYPTFKIT